MGKKCRCRDVGTTGVKLKAVLFDLPRRKWRTSSRFTQLNEDAYTATVYRDNEDLRAKVSRDSTSVYVYVPSRDKAEKQSQKRSHNGQETTWHAHHVSLNYFL